MKLNYPGKAILLICILSLFFAFLASSATLYAQDGAKKTDPPASSEKTNPYANADLSVRIIPSVNNTFGYDILIYGRPLVHQPSIPGLPGNEGFATKERAQKVAELVMKKIKNNEMPPTVTIEELSNLGVLK